MKSSSSMISKLTKIAKAFGIPGESVTYKCLKGGNINDTYVLEMSEQGNPKSYIIQRINANVFKNPVKVMENFDAVTRHIYVKLKKRGEPDVLRKTIKVYHRSDGSSLYVEGKNFWRVISCVYNATSLEHPTVKTIKNAEILCVGTELLLGDIVNTNASFMAQRLAELGVPVYRQSVVGDNPARLKEALAESFSRASSRRP